MFIGEGELRVFLFFYLVLNSPTQLFIIMYSFICLGLRYYHQLYKVHDFYVLVWNLSM